MKDKFRRVMFAAALFLGAIGGSMVGFGGGLPTIPSTPQFNEPSQIVSTLNALIQQLNGNPAGSGGYAAQPGNVVSLGSFCTASGATPQTCNASRGSVTFTGVTVAAVTNVNVVVNDSLIAATNSCRAAITADNSAAASFPYIRSVVTGAGTITIAIANAAAATSTGASNFGVLFTCDI